MDQGRRVVDDVNERTIKKQKRGHHIQFGVWEEHEHYIGNTVPWVHKK